MTGYIIDLDNRVETRTAAYYLGFLVAYLKHENREDLANYANNKKKEFVKKFREADKKVKSIPIKDVVTLYKSAPLIGKIMIRLLLLENLPIKSLEKISFIQTSEGNYQFNIDGNIINSINEETIRLAEPIIKENILKGDKRLLAIVSRTIEENIQGYAKKISLSNKLTPRDLRKFGRNLHPDDLKEMLKL
jgi:Flp pilus assembly protein CpaB